MLDREGIVKRSAAAIWWLPAWTPGWADGTQVAVQFGREVTITVDGKPTIWTTATNVDQAVGALDITSAAPSCPPAAAAASAARV